MNSVQHVSHNTILLLPFLLVSALLHLVVSVLSSPAVHNGCECRDGDARECLSKPTVALQSSLVLCGWSSPVLVATDWYYRATSQGQSAVQCHQRVAKDHPVAVQSCVQLRMEGSRRKREKPYGWRKSGADQRWRPCRQKQREQWRQVQPSTQHRLPCHLPQPGETEGA